jgi:hypothetical protein
MPEFFQFVQPPASLFQFSPTLDGATYNAIISFNAFAQRYYLNLFSPDGTRLLTRALVGSPTGVKLESLAWLNEMVVATTDVPHGYKIGDTIELTISGCLPETYNGKVRALITDEYGFSYPMPAFPGLASAVGIADYNVNLVAGYFETSTMVYRDANRQFEVSP